MVFRRAHPGINLRLATGNTAQVVTAVREGAVDIGFVEGIIDDPLLVIERIARDQLVIHAHDTRIRAASRPSQQKSCITAAVDDAVAQW